MILGECDRVNIASISPKSCLDL